MTTSHPLHAILPSDHTIAKEAEPTAAAADLLEVNCRTQWELSAELREQFSLGGFESWVAFAKAEPEQAKRLVSALAPAPISSPILPASTTPIPVGDEDPQRRALLDKLDGTIYAIQLGDRARTGAAVESTLPQPALDPGIRP